MTPYELGKMVKEAAPATPPGYQAWQHQQYMPQYESRELTPGELTSIEGHSRKPIPRIFRSLSDSPEVDMSSPGWNAALTGGLLGLTGATGGAAIGSASGNPALGALIGGGGLGTLGALAGYYSRRAGNRNIEERMRRLPEGATRRDIQADPLFQAELDRQTQQQQAAMIAAALGGSYRR